MAGQLAERVEANEALAGKLARLEHLLSRNSGNSSMPPSKDDGPGKPAPRVSPHPRSRRVGAQESGRGASSPGPPGSHLGFTDNPDDRRDRFPQGPVAATRIWAAPETSGSSTATSNTTSHRCR